MSFYIQIVKAQLHCDTIMFCKNAFRAIIQFIWMWVVYLGWELQRMQKLKQPMVALWLKVDITLHAVANHVSEYQTKQ